MSRISAGELREMGVPVPDNVPDCATVDRSAMRVNVTDSLVSSSGTLTIGMKVTFDEPFKWFECILTIGKENGGAAAQEVQ